MNKYIDIANTPYPCNINQILATYHNNDKSTITDLKNKHYVLWSGGCDSTLLLYELLTTYGPENVVAFSYIYDWLDKRKIENEHYHRELFKKKMALQKLDTFVHIATTIHHTQLQGDNINPKQGGGLPQALGWLLDVPLFAENDSYIYDGGIRSYQLTIRLEDYHKMFDGMIGLMSKNIKLRHPYIYLDKANIIERLINYDIYDTTWFCEMPLEDGSPCLTCDCCKDHMTGLLSLNMRDLTDNYIYEFVNRELDKFRNILKERKNNDNTSISINMEE